MEKIDTRKYNNRLKDYLDRKGVQYTKQGGVYRYICPNPGHSDTDPSAVLYENAGKGKNDRLWCASCPGGTDSSYDIFTVAGFYIGSEKFKEQIEEINRVLGMMSETTTGNEVQSKKKKETPKKNTEFVKVTKEQAQDIYLPEKVLEFAIKNSWGTEYTGYWPAVDENDMVMGVEFRLEGEVTKKDGTKKWEKSPMLFYWNGKSLKTKNPPHLIFGLDDLRDRPGLPIVVVEGPKPWGIAKENLRENFNFLTWNGASIKVDRPDWNFLNKIDTPIFFFPDDDTPGKKAAEKFKEIVPRTIIIDPIPEAREIKKKGADIEEALQIFGITKLCSYILSFAAIDSSQQHSEKPSTPNKSVAANDYLNEPEEIPPIEDIENEENEPFKVLGVADDGQAYFIDLEERMLITPLEGINEKKMLRLASAYWWINRFGDENKMSRTGWLFATDFLIRSANRKDFDPDNIRGRGCWREHDGRICYHDGRHTVGEYDKKRVYVKRTQSDIGLHDPPADVKTCQKIGKIVSRMSFERKVDAVRALSWSVLAPFCGGLPWRPAALLTGDSGSGKSTLVDHVVKKLAAPVVFSGMESSPAGIRQYISMDSCAVVIEESGDDQQSKIEKKQDYFSIMRQSTGDDSPKAVKGTKSHVPVVFNLKSMFMFVAIDPEVEHDADDNRIFQINMVKADTGVEYWKQLENELIKIMTEENCRAVRSLTWQKLKVILSMSEYLLPLIEVVTKKDVRRCIADSLLIAAYIVVWRGQEKINELDAGEIIFELLKNDEIEEKKNDAEDIIDRLLDRAVFCPENRVRRSFRQMLHEMSIGEHFRHEEEYKSMLEQHGIKLMKNKKDIAIVKNFPATMEAIGRKNKYAKTILRHPAVKEKNSNVWIAGASRKCVIFSGLIQRDENEDMPKNFDFESDSAYQ